MWYIQTTRQANFASKLYGLALNAVQFIDCMLISNVHSFNRKATGFRSQ
jgi:hypothetical protein